MEKKYVRASNRKHHIVYKTTCLETNKFYIGMHSTDNLMDGYIGSGVRLTRSVRKYGKEKHVSEILFDFKSRQEASDKEKELITIELQKDPMCLNTGSGGEGYYDRPPTAEETKKKLSEASKKYVRTKEWYEKVVATRKAGNKYIKTNEEKEKIRKALTGKKLTEEHKKKISEGGIGLKRTEETCKNISKATKGKSKVLPPFSKQHKESIRQSRLGKTHSEEAKQNMRKSKSMKANMRKCPLDGITIYDSVKAFEQIYGQGKNGTKHPNFRIL